MSEPWIKLYAAYKALRDAGFDENLLWRAFKEGAVAGRGRGATSQPSFDIPPVEWAWQKYKPMGAIEVLVERKAFNRYLRSLRSAAANARPVDELRAFYFNLKAATPTLTKYAAQIDLEEEARRRWGTIPFGIETLRRRLRKWEEEFERRAA